MKLLANILVFLLMINSSAQALPRAPAAPSAAGDGFVLEPALGYSAGTLKQTGMADIGTQVGFGEVRAGYKYSDFTLGLSYMMGFGTGEQWAQKSDFKPTDTGAYLLYDLMWGFNLFGAYLVSSKAKIQSEQNSADFSGQGYRGGVKWTGLPFCSVIVEYISRTYTKYDNTTLSKSIKDSSTAVSLSFPIK